MREAIATDVRLALRLIRRQKLYAATIVLTLAVGVALCAAAATLTEAILLRPLPYRGSDRLAAVYLASPSRNIDQLTLSHEEYRDLTRRQTFSQTAGYVAWNAVLAGTDEAERVQINLVTPSYFELLGLTPGAGRLFTPAEDASPNGAPVAILSHGFWQRRFGGSQSAIGQAIRLDGVPLTIVGVLRAGVVDVPSPQSETDVWVPLMMSPRFIQPAVLEDRRMRNVATIVRLADGRTLAAAQAEMNAVARQWDQDHPETNQSFGLVVDPLQNLLLGNLRSHLIVLSCAAAFVLLIACVNVANLMLIRGSARIRELAIRASIGASHGRLVRQLMTESLVLSLGGAMAGVGISPALVGVLLLLSPIRLPLFVDVAASAEVVAGLILVAALTGTLCSVWPAVQLTRSGAADALRSDSRGSTSDRGRRRWQRTLVVTQVALATALVMSTSSAVIGFKQLRAIDPGYQPDSLLTFRINLNGESYAQNAARVEGIRRVLRELLDVPGVATADVWSPNMPGSAVWVALVVAEGHRRESMDDWTVVRRHHVTPEALKHLGVVQVAGRGIDDSDRPETEPVAVVSESLARALWPGQEAVGKRLYGFQTGVALPQSPRYVVVGVVRDVKHLGRARPARIDGGRDVYYAYPQVPRRELAVMVRSRVEASALGGAIRAAVQRADSTFAAYDVATMDERMRVDESRSRFTAVIISVFAALALGLAALGLYGVLGYSILERTREIGVRLAMGATARQILVTTLGGAMMLVAAGLGAGLAAGAALGPLARNWSEALGSVDIRSIALAAAVMLITGAAAAVLPAVRASRVDPLVALRDG